MPDEDTLNSEEKQALLGIARSAIAGELNMKKPPPAPVSSPRLESRSGAFVSLHKRGALRGCIGRFESQGPLIETIKDMAKAAAFEDPRFPPLKPNELDEVDVEISVLTPMRRIDDLEEIEVGRHGLYMVRGPMRGVLLPQVATEYHWDRQAFLEHTCQKAGLEKDCWRDDRTEIFVFSAEVFGEPQ